MTAPTWYVYVAQCADDSLYCGITTDPVRRLAQHNGQVPGGAKYTRGRRPICMLGWVPQQDKQAAARLEYRLRRLPREQKLDRLLASTPGRIQVAGSAPA